MPVGQFMQFTAIHDRSVNSCNTVAIHCAFSIKENAHNSPFFVLKNASLWIIFTVKVKCKIKNKKNLIKFLEKLTKTNKYMV